jgi:hypothetical protein
MTNPPPITRVQRFKARDTVLVCRCLAGAQPFIAEIVEVSRAKEADNAMMGGGLAASAKYLVRRTASNLYSHVYDSQLDPVPAHNLS